MERHFLAYSADAIYDHTPLSVSFMFKVSEKHTTYLLHGV